MKKSQWDEVMELNLSGVFLCTQISSVTAEVFILKILGTETHGYSL